MITVAQIESLVAEKIQDTDFFIVAIKVNPGNKIVVLIDGMSGIGIDECVSISRHIEGSLDREIEDFELEVSSPGLTSPFVVLAQYEKYLGKQVEVKTESGTKVKGELSEVMDDKVVVTTKEKKRIEGRKKKELVEEKIDLFFQHEDLNQQIKSTKIVISFK